MKTELSVFDSTCIEAEWIRNFFSEILVMPSPKPPIAIHCDPNMLLNYTSVKVLTTK